MPTENFTVAPSIRLTLFNPSFIDDYGFTPEEFRVFARIMRRAAGENSEGCYESVPKMSGSLQIGERLVRRALRVLERCNAITRRERPGTSDVIDFVSCEHWIPSIQLPVIRAEIDVAAKTSDRTRKAQNDTPCGKDRGTLPLAERTGVPLAERTGEGIPIKGIPISAPSVLAPPAENPHRTGMKMLHDLVGPYPDGGAQAKALGWMLKNGATLEQIEAELRRQIDACENGTKFRPSFLTVQKTVFPPSSVILSTPFPSLPDRNLIPPPPGFDFDMNELRAAMTVHGGPRHDQ